MSEREDTRDAIELSADENADLCAGCSRCCESVSIEIDKPRTNYEYDQWIWVLHHENLEIYVEKPEAWYLHIATRCAQLGDDQRCRIYGRHPVLCREYDPRGCERRAPLSDIVAWFKTAAEFEAWLEVNRPVHYKRMMKWRKHTPQAKPKADARRERQAMLARTLVQIADPRRYSAGPVSPAAAPVASAHAPAAALHASGTKRARSRRA
jgi:Fe-S-cluster containining protein